MTQTAAVNDATTTGRYRDGTYLAHNPDWHDGDGAWKASRIYDLLVRNQVQPRSVCDVGCGTGRVLDELAALLPALSQSPEAIRDSSPGAQGRQCEYLLEMIAHAHGVGDAGQGRIDRHTVVFGLSAMVGDE